MFDKVVEKKILDANLTEEQLKLLLAEFTILSFKMPHHLMEEEEIALAVLDKCIDKVRG